MVFKATAVAFMVLAALATTQAYPQLWVREAASNCFDTPAKGYACHKTPQMDKATSISVSDASGKAVSSVCPGKTYTVSVKFPEQRLSYLTLNSGAVAQVNTLNSKCKNTFTFSRPTGFSPSSSVSVSAVAPSAGSWEVSVVSATGGCAAFQVAKASVPVGKC